MVSRKGITYRTFNVIIIWLGILSSFAYAYFAAFSLDVDSNPNWEYTHYIEVIKDSGFWNLQIITEVLFAFDLVL